MRYLLTLILCIAVYIANAQKAPYYFTKDSMPPPKGKHIVLSWGAYINTLNSSGINMYIDSVKPNDSAWIYIFKPTDTLIQVTTLPKSITMEKKIQEGPPIFMESLLNNKDYVLMSKKYSNTYNSSSYRGLSSFTEGEFKCRYGMGGYLSLTEIENINSNLEYIRKKFGVS